MYQLNYKHTYMHMYTKTHVHTATTATVRVFDKIARKHNVTYFLSGGTLIGGLGTPHSNPCL